MRSAAALLALLVAAGAAAQTPAIPTPRGFVTDTANVIPPDVEMRVTNVATELRAKTGAEIAVLTVDTTEPLDDFTYAMRVVDAWRPGRKRDDTGLLVLLAIRDRKLRVLTGYGLEGVLPDGLVGQIQDEHMVPALRAGRPGDAIERGVRAFAGRIAAERGVTLTGVPPPRVRAPEPAAPDWRMLLVLLLVFGAFALLASRGDRRRFGRRRRGGFAPYWGGGGFGGGFGGGGGGFGGFGGGGFGGGGAGRSW